MIKKEELGVILKRLSAVYPNHPISSELVEDWILAFNDMNISQMTTGLVRCLKEHDSGFFPSPAEFRKFCLNSSNNRPWAREENMIEEKPSNPVPMPQEFKDLFKKFTDKTTI